MQSRFLKDHLNRDVLNSSLNQLWRIVSGPVTLLLIPLFISPQIQGFWYTFTSVSALGVLADLGFTTIVTQFVAHEYAFLSFDRDGVIVGDATHLSNLASFLRFVGKWALISGFTVMPMIFGIGFALFVQKADVGVWLVPWALFSTGTMINYWNSMLVSFLQGCKQVAKIQLISLVCMMVQTLVLFCLLVLGKGLLAQAISLLFGSVLTMAALLMFFGRQIGRLLAIRSDRRWGKEVVSLLWRYALSWAGGYLNLQIITPIVFQYKGAVVAGKVGITMSLWMAATTLSGVWFSANIPRINISVARKEEKALGRIIQNLLLLSLASYLAGFAGIAVIVFIGNLLHIEYLSRIVGRFLGLPAILVLVGAGLPILVVNAMAVYLRAHKEEPLVKPSIATGICTALLSFVAIRYFSDSLMFIGMLVSNAALFVWNVRIYQRKRGSWLERGSA